MVLARTKPTEGPDRKRRGRASILLKALASLAFAKEEEQGRGSTTSRGCELYCWLTLFLAGLVFLGKMSDRRRSRSSYDARESQRRRPSR